MSDSPRQSSLSQPLAEFLGWWVSELAGMVPGWIRRAVNPPPRKIAIAFGGTLIHVIDQRPNGKIRTLATIPNGADTVSRLTAATARVSLAHSQIGVRMPVSVLLERRMDLPIAARNQAAEILTFDLEQVTPFKANQVYTSHYLGVRSADGKHMVAHQFVAKRETLDQAIDLAAAAGLDISFADAYREHPEDPLPINFLAAQSDLKNGSPWQTRAASALLATAIGLGALLLVQIFNNQARALSLLQARTVVVQAKAIKVRKQIETLQTMVNGQRALLQRKVGPPTTVQIIEELTRILPDTAWIGELRVDQGTIEIGGYSKSAAALVPLVEKSSLFQNAAFSAPVTLDPRYSAERFSIRFEIKSAAPALHEASAGGSKQ